MKFRKSLAVASIAAFLLAACGSKSNDSSGDGSKTKNAALATAPVGLVNGDFVAAKGGWAGVGFALGVGCKSTSAGANRQPSLGGWLPNALSFGTTQQTVTQSVTVASPGKIVFLFTGQVRGDMTNGSFSAKLSDADESVTTGPQTGAGLVTAKSYELSVTTKAANESVKIDISGGTSTNWAGCYGPVVTNASLFSAAQLTAAINSATTLVPPVTTAVPPVMPSTTMTVPPTTGAPVATAPPSTLPSMPQTTQPTTAPIAPSTTSTVAPATTMSAVACDKGGPCRVGDVGPSGGWVIFANDSLPAGSRYIEVTTRDYDNPQYGYRRFDIRYLDSDLRYGDALASVNQANLDRLGGQSNWRVPSRVDANFLCLYIRQITTGSDCAAPSPGVRPGFSSWYWTADSTQLGKAWLLGVYEDNVYNGQRYGCTCGVMESPVVDKNHVRFVRTF